MESVRFADGDTSAPLPISQIAIVVNDIENAVEKFPPRVAGPVDRLGAQAGAEAHAGPIDVELLQALDAPSI
jgi:hypothetical protein